MWAVESQRCRVAAVKMSNCTHLREVANDPREKLEVVHNIMLVVQIGESREHGELKCTGQQ